MIGSQNTIFFKEEKFMLDYFIYSYGNQIALMILCAIFGCFGYALKRLCTKYINDSTKRSIARIVVQFVEQTWKTIHGPEKMREALKTAEALLRKKGIDFDAEEMEVLIEAAVAEFNEVFKKPIDTESTADAVRRVDGFSDTETAQPNTETVNT